MKQALTSKLAQAWREGPRQPIQRSNDPRPFLTRVGGEIDRVIGRGRTAPVNPTPPPVESAIVADDRGPVERWTQRMLLPITHRREMQRELFETRNDPERQRALALMDPSKSPGPLSNAWTNVITNAGADPDTPFTERVLDPSSWGSREALLALAAPPLIAKAAPTMAPLAGPAFKGMAGKEVLDGVTNYTEAGPSIEWFEQSTNPLDQQYAQQLRLARGAGAVRDAGTAAMWLVPATNWQAGRGFMGNAARLGKREATSAMTMGAGMGANRALHQMHYPAADQELRIVDPEVFLAATGLRDQLAAAGVTDPRQQAVAATNRMVHTQREHQARMRTVAERSAAQYMDQRAREAGVPELGDSRDVQSHLWRWMKTPNLEDLVGAAQVEQAGQLANELYADFAKTSPGVLGQFMRVLAHEGGVDPKTLAPAAFADINPLDLRTVGSTAEATNPLFLDPMSAARLARALERVPQVSE